MPILTVEREGKVAATLEYDMVRDYTDVLRVDAGEQPIGGEVCYVSNLEVKEPDPSLIWKLKRQLPKARYVVGLTEQWELKAPKGVPGAFFQ